MGSMRVSLTRTDNTAIVPESKYDQTYSFSWTDYIEEYKRKSPVSIVEIGPEWQFKVWDKGELYLQLNVGRTFSSGDASTWYDWGSYYYSSKVRTNTWTLGTAFGARYFFTPNCGAAVQLGYHYLDNWWYSPLWDARAGVVFRF